MANARTEFLEHIENRKVKCAAIYQGDEWRGERRIAYLLPIGYDQTKWDAFLASLNFDYYDGYGVQKLFGDIWYEDGTWSARREYDGSEWWDYLACPPIPDTLS